MRVNLTSIVRYIFLELDFYLKLQKDAENWIYISVTKKGQKRFYPCFVAKWWFCPYFLNFVIIPCDFKRKVDFTPGMLRSSNGVNF